MYTYVHSSTRIRGNVKYPITDKPDQAERGERVEAAIFRGGLLDTGDATSVAEQFEYYLNLAGRRYRKGADGKFPILCWIKTVSFSENEIAKDDPEGADKALAIVEKAQENLAPDCLWMAVAQKDGKGGFWHVHVVQNAVHSSTLKACSGRETSRDFFKEHIEEAAVDMGITLDSGKSHKKREEKKAIKKRESAKQKDGYVWMDDLEGRIAKAASEARRLREYEERLNANGVNVTRKTKSGWTYELTECEHEEFIGKKARYDKFSQDFSQSTLNKLFNMNYKRWVVKGGQPSAEQTDTGRQLPDISGIKMNIGSAMERKDDE